MSPATFASVPVSGTNQTPLTGRHDTIFPMFEFECHGGTNALIQIEKDLLERLGISGTLGFSGNYPEKTYDHVAQKYNVDRLEHEHGDAMDDDYGHVLFLKRFPNTTLAFWNVKQCHKDTNTAHQVDVILHGVKTMGSAALSCDAEEMRRRFYNISDGKYAKILFSQFAKKRVKKEFEDLLALSFFERCGGAISVTRMIRAMQLHHLI